MRSQFWWVIEYEIPGEEKATTLVRETDFLRSLAFLTDKKARISNVRAWGIR